MRSIQDINTSIWWTLLWKPHQFTLENYNTVLHTAGSIGMGQAFLNSLDHHHAGHDTSRS